MNHRVSSEAAIGGIVPWIPLCSRSAQTTMGEAPGLDWAAAFRQAQAQAMAPTATAGDSESKSSRAAEGRERAPDKSTTTKMSEQRVTPIRDKS